MVSYPRRLPMGSYVYIRRELPEPANEVRYFFLTISLTKSSLQKYSMPYYCLYLTQLGWYTFNLYTHVFLDARKVRYLPYLIKMLILESSYKLVERLLEDVDAPLCYDSIDLSLVGIWVLPVGSADPLQPRHMRCILAHVQTVEIYR